MEQTDAIRSLIEGPITDRGLSLVSIELSKEAGRPVLRLVLDKDGGISLAEIVEVTKIVSPLLDRLSSLPNGYLLDINSRGIEKKIDLKELSNYLKEYVHLTFSTPIEGQMEQKGIIADVDEESLTLLLQAGSRKKRVRINRDDITGADLAVRL